VCTERIVASLDRKRLAWNFTSSPPLSSAEAFPIKASDDPLQSHAIERSRRLLITYRISVSALAILHSPRPANFHMAEKPPSTASSTPFTKLESSEARNSATVAISSG
jgi:hypothetical protein